jgi:hypothetical protein
MTDDNSQYTSGSERYKCPECGGEFTKPAEVSKTTLKLGVGFVEYDAKGCLWCGEAISATAHNASKITLFNQSQQTDTDHEGKDD